MGNTEACLLCLYLGITFGYFAHKVEAWMWRRELHRARIKREQRKRRAARLTATY